MPFVMAKLDLRFVLPFIPDSQSGSGALIPKVPNTLLAHILSAYSAAQPAERSRILSSPEMKEEYFKAAMKGDYDVPERAQDEVDYHHTCFVKSDGHLLELDGDLGGSIDLGALNEDEDVLSRAALVPIERFIQANGNGNIGFSMLALVNGNEL